MGPYTTTVPTTTGSTGGIGGKPRRTTDPHTDKGGVQMVELAPRHTAFTPSPDDRGSAVSQSPDVFLPTSPRSTPRDTPPPPSRPHSSFLSATLAALLPSPPTNTPGARGQPGRDGGRGEEEVPGARSPLIGVTVGAGGAKGGPRPKRLLPGDLWERLCAEVVSLAARTLRLSLVHDMVVAPAC
jgi:hypothetical protein